MTRRRDADPTPLEPVDRLLTRVFAPMDKRALGVAVGVTSAAALATITVVHILGAADDGLQLELLAQYFYGYRVSWLGALVGAAWASVAGFAAGWMLALVRNLAVATWLRFMKARVELFETRDFLDHL